MSAGGTSQGLQTEDKAAGLAFSFFSGAGMLDSGLESVGLITAFANEYSATFLRGYQHGRRSLHLPPPLMGTLEGSLEQLVTPQGRAWLQARLEAAYSLGRPVGFVGGPPCPDFSEAGLNAGSSGINGRLAGVYIDMACRHQPDFVAFENVRGLWRAHRDHLEELRAQLEGAGYATYLRLCNALEYGVPQDRWRVFMIAFRRASFPALAQAWPENQPHQAAGGRASIGPAGFWEAGITHDLATLQAVPWPDQDPFVDGGALQLPAGVPVELTVEHWFRRNAVETHPNAAQQFIPKAGLSKMSSIAEGHSRGKSFKRLHRWRYSNTAAYGNNEVHLHPYRPRRLSVAEALAIQSMPAAFELPSSMGVSAAFKTVGNGVPYLMGQGIGRSIVHHLADLESAGGFGRPDGPSDDGGDA